MAAESEVEEVDQYSGSGDLMEGGWVLYKRKDNTHFIEATEGRLKDNGGNRDDAPWDRFEVFRHDVPEDVYKEFSWVGESDSERLRAGRADDVVVRAAEIGNIGDAHGWVEIDNYPLTLSGKELRKRWLDEDWDEGTREEFKDATNRVSEFDKSSKAALLYAARTAYETADRTLLTDLRYAARLRCRAIDAEGAQRQIEDADYHAGKIAEMLNNAKYPGPAFDIEGAEVFISLPNKAAGLVVFKDGKWAVWVQPEKKP